MVEKQIRVWEGFTLPKDITENILVLLFETLLLSAKGQVTAGLVSSAAVFFWDVLIKNFRPHFKNYSVKINLLGPEKYLETVYLLL